MCSDNLSNEKAQAGQKDIQCNAVC
eukprot:COSAG01_NODE_69231_length_262_cov_0.527607_1_plen_24_part_01